MQVREPRMLAEVIPPAPKNVLRPQVAERSRNRDRQMADEGNVGSFSQILVERREERPPEAGGAQRKHNADGQSTQSVRESSKGQQDSAMRHAPAKGNVPAKGQAPAQGVTVSSISATPLSGAEAKNQFGPVVAAGAGQDAPLAPTGLEQTAVASLAGSETPVGGGEGPAAAVFDTDAAAVPGKTSSTAVAVAAPEASPTVAVKTPALAGTGSAPALTTTVQPQPATPTAPAAAATTDPMPAETAVGTVPQDASQNTAKTATGNALPDPASAVALDSAAKAQAVYRETPVVSEAQIVSEAMKQNQKGSAPVTSVDNAAQVTDGAEVKLAAGQEQSTEQQATEQQATEGDDIQPSPAAVADVSLKSSTREGAKAKAETSDDAAQATNTVAATSASVPAAPSQAGAAAHLQTPGAAGPHSPTTALVHRQIVTHLAHSLTDITGQEKITIKLNPESLGQVELNFESRNDQLSVVMAATSTEADAALRENIRDLSDRIVERSTRFSHVDIRVQVREGHDARPDGKPEQRQNERQEQRREQGGRHGDHEQQQENKRQGRQTQQARQSWESAMSWHLAGQAANEEG